MTNKDIKSLAHNEKIYEIIQIMKGGHKFGFQCQCFRFDKILSVEDIYTLKDDSNNLKFVNKALLESSYLTSKEVIAHCNENIGTALQIIKVILSDKDECNSIKYRPDFYKGKHIYNLKFNYISKRISLEIHRVVSYDYGDDFFPNYINAIVREI